MKLTTEIPTATALATSGDNCTPDKAVSAPANTVRALNQSVLLVYQAFVFILVLREESCSRDPSRIRRLDPANVAILWISDLEIVIGWESTPHKRKMSLVIRKTDADNHEADRIVQVAQDSWCVYTASNRIVFARVMLQVNILRRNKLTGFVYKEHAVCIKECSVVREEIWRVARTKKRIDTLAKCCDVAAVVMDTQT